ncbi:inorganic diphosphatase [Oceanirhabdus seepicola]|uniref:inorganic diphosphatase n=1 Tax=Oceanirhabdus seepicola TaxID=2828781 RepID=A0A9J6P408_9CLOT|nr:inorganic diphosphatase [Oceanirhabdus seepicola]MCM1991514.1 inorganic diphosphatase [Oceanirhabdus seepicola]
MKELDKMKEYFGKEVQVIMDRPMGSKHPEHGFIYPINYGYIPNTVAGDGEEIDAYVLGEFEPLERYTGRVIAIIHRKDDDEDKLVVARDSISYSKDQIEALTEFTERFYDSEVLCSEFIKKDTRVSAKGFARRGEEILVIEEKDASRGSVYYRLFGGGMKFQEKATEALRREYKEEVGAELISEKFLGVIENPFEINGVKAHEIMMLYEVELPQNYYENEKFISNCDLGVSEAMWVNKSEFIKGNKVLLPVEIVEYL